LAGPRVPSRHTSKAGSSIGSSGVEIRHYASPRREPDTRGETGVRWRASRPGRSDYGAPHKCRGVARPHGHRPDYGAELCSAATILEIGGRHDWWTLFVPFQEVFVA
jgi:hypothetical protein